MERKKNGKISVLSHLHVKLTPEKQLKVLVSPHSLYYQDDQSEVTEIHTRFC